MSEQTVTIEQESTQPPAAEPPPSAPLRVGWVGALPDWLDRAEHALTSVEVAPIDGSPKFEPDVVHVTSAELSALGSLRNAFHGARLVLDISSREATSLGWRDGARAARADLILAGSLFDLREIRRRHPKLASRTAILREPIDLLRWGPEAPQLNPEGRTLRRFRRHHRLAFPTIVYAGPYTPEGGLDLAVEAVQMVSRTFPDVRLASVPLGAVKGRYLDRCERAALSLGHRGLIQWTALEDELPLWFSAADVICMPSRDAVCPQPVWLAAAAGKPVVAGEVPQLLEHVDDNVTGYLIPTGDATTLAAALVALIGDRQEAARLGAAAREKVERERSPTVAARALQLLWTSSIPGRA